MKFSIRITKTIATCIEVEAKHATAARKQIEEYGLQEAISDYKVLSEDVRTSLGYATVLSL